MTKVELNLVTTYNLHCLSVSVMQQEKLGKEAAAEEETLYVVLPLLKTRFLI